MAKDKDFYYKKSRLAQLRGYCAVVQAKHSITKAAKRINVETSTLSKQVSALERDLGVKLIDRSEHKNLKATKEGELFYAEAVQHLNGIDSLFENFNHHLKEYNENHLNIAMHKGIATFVFPAILDKMLKLEEFKNLKVAIYSIPKDEAIEKLTKRDIDLAFYIQDSRDELPTELDTIKFMRSRAYLVFSKFHPLAKKDIITREDIKKYKFLERETGTKKYNNVYAKSHNSIPTHLDINKSNIKLIGTSSSDIALEIIKYNNEMITTASEISLRDKKYRDKSDIETRDIEHLLDKAFFHIIKLKNNPLSKAATWMVTEFKKIKISQLL